MLFVVALSACRWAGGVLLLCLPADGLVVTSPDRLPPFPYGVHYTSVTVVHSAQVQDGPAGDVATVAGGTVAGILVIVAIVAVVIIFVMR